MASIERARFTIVFASFSLSVSINVCLYVRAVMLLCRHLFTYKLTTKQNKDHKLKCKIKLKMLRYVHLFVYSFHHSNTRSFHRHWVFECHVARLSLVRFILSAVVSPNCFRYLYSCQSISLSNVSKWLYGGISLHQTHINFRFISCTHFYCLRHFIIPFHVIGMVLLMPLYTYKCISMFFDQESDKIDS